MSFVIQYYRHQKMVWESSWTLDIPPSCRAIRRNFAVHRADKAVILDDDGFVLIVEERQKYDA